MEGGLRAHSWVPLEESGGQQVQVGTWKPWVAASFAVLKGLRLETLEPGTHRLGPWGLRAHRPLRPPLPHGTGDLPPTPSHNSSQATENQAAHPVSATPDVPNPAILRPSAATRQHLAGPAALLGAALLSPHHAWGGPLHAIMSLWLKAV